MLLGLAAAFLTVAIPVQLGLHGITLAWAVEGVLDGTIDRFSIGWHPTARVLCSVHKKALRGKDGCWCWPGQEVEGEVVEAIFGAADGVVAVNSRST